MTNEIEKLLQGPGLDVTAFDESSRYHGLQLRQRVNEQGERQVYVQRRLIPRPDTFQDTATHVIVEGDRVDNIAAHYLGNPLSYWQLCDANVVLSPKELTDIVNRKIRITLPGDRSV